MVRPRNFCNICNHIHKKADKCLVETKAEAVDAIVNLITRDIVRMIEPVVRQRLSLWADEIRPDIDAVKDEPKP